MAEIDIEKQLFPDSNELREDGTATIVDAELDPIECVFHGDGCVKLKTEGYEYVTLSEENLIRLLELIDELGENNSLIS